MRLPTGQPWTTVGPWVLASLPFVFMVAWFWNRGPGLNADDWAQTLMHAEALAEGRPYGDIGYIATRLDIAPPRQPPGLPVVVAATLVLAGGLHWATIKLAMALAAFPFLLLSGLSFARTHGSGIGMGVMVMLTVAVAATPPSAATHIQSDLGFASLVWAVLYLLDGPARLTWPRIAAVFAFGSLAMTYRYLGAALVPTITLFALIHRQKDGPRLAAPLAVWGAGVLAVIALAGPYIVTTQVSLDPNRLWRGIVPMVNAYSGAAVSSHLYPLPWNGANDAFHAVSLTLAIVGIVAWTRTSWRSASWLFTAGYLLTLLMAYNRSGRYLIPLYPVIIFGLVHGTAWVLGRMRAWSQERASLAAAGAVVAVALAALAFTVSTEPRQGGSLPDLPAAQELFAFLRSEDAESPARVAFVKPRVIAWATGVPAMVVPGPGVRPEGFLAELDRQGITHVVLDRIDIEIRRTENARRMVDTYGCRFESTFDNGSFEVYRVLPPCADVATS